MYSASAWLLPIGDEKKPGPGNLEFGSITIDPLDPDEVLVEPLLAGWEGNCFHAVERTPIDVCRERAERNVVLGNGGVVRVLKPGSAVRDLKEGQVCLLQANYRPDPFGYPMHGAAFGFERRGTIGLLAKRTKIRGSCLVPLPENTRHSLAQWAAFSVRYVTAFGNWHVALGAWRTQVTEADQAVPYVWGWGGGTTFAELTLAKLHGADCTIVTSRENRVALAEAYGLRAVDRRRFPDLELDEERAKVDPEHVRRHLQSEEAFLRTVLETTHGLGVSIFIDYLGGQLFGPTLKALARQGVTTTAGWREGMRLTLDRAVECAQRRQHIHTHYARRSEVEAAMAFGEEHGWMPPLGADEEPWAYERVPELVAAYRQGRLDSYFPLIQVNA